MTTLTSPPPLGGSTGRTSPSTTRAEDAPVVPAPAPLSDATKVMPKAVEEERQPARVLWKPKGGVVVCEVGVLGVWC